MADTSPIVRWSLSQTCKLRDADSLADPCVAMQQTSGAQTYARLSSDPSHGFGVFGDICVTSSVHATSLDHKSTRNRPTIYLPCSGFVISDEFRPLGGAAGLREMCRNCPANTHPNNPAGCTGTLYQHPDRPETQAQLESILSRLGLASDFADHFPAATPLWYGLWARSPLSPRAAQLLGTIISTMHDDDANEPASDPRHHRHLADLTAFVRATDLAARHHLPLHVSLAPLGHTDFGIYTVFPHCPFCKAPAQLPRWRRQHPTQLHTCPTCGTRYSPAETSSQERMSLDDDRTELRHILGPKRYDDFATSCLIQSGLTESQARDALAAHHAWEHARDARIAQDQDRARRQSQFLHSTLFAGLHPTHDDDPEADEHTDVADKLPYFSADDFATVLRRCTDQGIKVLMMFHKSQSEHLDRHETRRLPDPTAVFSKWRAEGCNERFAAFFKVPDSLLPPPTP
jgi:hypothetical protein